MITPQESVTTEPDVGIDALRELTLNLRWAWHHGTDELWAELEPELWRLTHNPWVVLQTASRRRLQDLLARPESRARITSLLGRRRQYLTSPAWFQQSHPQSPLTHAAYFSMEFSAQRGPPHLLRWTRQRGGGSTQGGQRSRRPGRRGRSAVPAGLLPPGDCR